MSKNTIDLIYDIIKEEKEESTEFRKEVRENNSRLQEKLTKIEIETSERLSKIESLDEVQNQQLADHMRRTELLEQLHMDNKKRIETLEVPTRILITVAIWAGWISAIAGAAYSLIKLIRG